MITKKVCLDKTFPLGHFMLHFIMFLCQMTTKASNELEKTFMKQSMMLEWEKLFQSSPFYPKSVLRGDKVDSG